jgi:hypothetical protein
MMNDANREHGEPMRVRDVAEVVVEAMGTRAAATAAD